MDIKKGLIEIFDNKDIINIDGKKYLLNPLTDHFPITTSSMLKVVVKGILKIGNFKGVDKIIGEEERGGFIVPLVSYKINKPFSLAKWNPLGLNGEICLNFKNMYTGGKIFLNGIKPGDKVVIIEDMIDTGGTIISLINLLKSKKVIIKEIIAISIKKEAKGLEKIYNETGYRVKYLCEFSVAGKKSKLIKFNDNI